MGCNFIVTGSRESSAHGAGADVVIVDEYAQFKDDSLYSTMEEALSARPDTMMICLSTLSHKMTNPMSSLINLVKASKQQGVDMSN